MLESTRGLSERIVSFRVRGGGVQEFASAVPLPLVDGVDNDARNLQGCTSWQPRIGWRALFPRAWPRTESAVIGPAAGRPLGNCPNPLPLFPAIRTFLLIFRVTASSIDSFSF